MALNDKDDFGKRPQFELVSHRGETFGPYNSRDEAKQAGERKWPGMESADLSDDEPSGWYIQVVGADIVHKR